MTSRETTRYPGYVLAGGQSRRLGRDKARARLDDETTVLQAVVSSVESTCQSWTIVADRPDKYDDLGWPTIADDPPHRGPLGGILRAAEATETGYFFVTSCDRIGLRARWVHKLADHLDAEPPAVCFASDGRLEPLFAFYDAALADKLRRALGGDRRAVWRFLDSIDTRRLPAPDDWNETIPVNTSEQLAEARRRFTHR